MRKKVLLLYPSTSPDNPNGDTEFMEGINSIPFGILSIASQIGREGFDVKIIDCRLYPKKTIMNEIEKNLDNYFCVGLSCTTPQVSHGLMLTDFIKRLKPKMPIVWGGIHTTLFPKQTIVHKNIDYVIYGEGDLSFPKLLKNILENKPQLKEIGGLAYKRNGKIFVNKPVKPCDINELAPPDYDMMDIDKYIDRDYVTHSEGIRKIRALDINTSRGCPYLCTFCINCIPSLKKWRPVETKETLRRIDYLIKNYNLNHLHFSDDFFFGDTKRVKKIAEHLTKKKYNITWEAQIRANLFKENLVNDSFLKLIKKSGCYCLAMGFESGSNRILNKIKKYITTEQIINSVMQCKKHGILTKGYFMCGFPTETKEELMQTANLILKLKKIQPEGIFYSPSLLRPYPGAELYQECVERGFDEPKKLEDWAAKKVQIGSMTTPEDLPWLEDPKFVINFQVYLHILIVYISHRLTNKKLNIIWAITGRMAQFRFRHNFWSFSIDAKILLFMRVFLQKGNIITRFIKRIIR